MKNLLLLLLGFMCIALAPTPALAVDFSAKGQWVMSFDAGDSGSFSKYTNRSNQKSIAGYKGTEDFFEASQRIRLQLDVAASEALSGTVQFELGESSWGKADQGAALGTDGTNVKLKHAYITWQVPNTGLMLRMGLQGVALPAFTTKGSEVFDDDVAAVVASYAFNNTVTLSALWARPYNDNYLGGGSASAFSADNIDTFGLLLPITLPGINVTPWLAYSHIGPNFIRTNNDLFGQAFGMFSSNARRGLFPNYFAYNRDRFTANASNPMSFDYAVMTRPSSGFWAGLTGEVTAFDPWRFAWDANYGAAKHEFDWLNREGWYVSALAEYALNWGIPGLYAWYSSGDDNDPTNGSERLPSISADGDNEFSGFAFSGNSYIGRENAIGNAMYGTWGIGARVKNMSFVEDLRHTLRINYIGGTNSPSMAKYMTGTKSKAAPYDSGWGNMDFNGDDKVYLTTQDSALEFGLNTEYKLYDNMKIYLEANYIALWLDNDTWKAGANSKMAGGPNAIHHVSGKDAWNINLAFVYDFF